MAGERAVQFRDESEQGTRSADSTYHHAQGTRLHFGAVIEHRVEALEDGLGGQVQLVEEDPVAVDQRVQEGAVDPGEGARGRVRHWQVAAQQVHHVRLLGQVQARHPVPRTLAERHDQRRLADTRRPFQENGLAKLQGTKDARDVPAGAGRLKVVPPAATTLGDES